MKLKINLLVFVFYSLLLLFTASLTAQSKHPNFVLILADDLGYGDLGCYGSERNRTPYLDQLAREGLRFTDFHSNGPMCSPTRAALLTGRYQQRVGIENALAIDVLGLPQAAITIPERLKEAGYATAIFGKWHLGNLKPSNPIHHGFDVFKGHQTSATDYKSHIDRNGNYDWYHNDKMTRHGNYNTIEITEDAVEFIEGNKDQPFFLYVSHSAIHFPWMEPMDPGYRKEGVDYNKGLVKLGPRGTDRDVSPVVQAMIESLDASVGRIIEALKDNGLEENTLVFFTSDNGGYIHYQGNHENEISSNGPYRDQKGSVFEGGHRVPAIAWWPGKIATNLTTDETVLTMDLMPTYLRMAGLELPKEKSQQAMDGVDISQLLFERRAIEDQRTVFWRKGDDVAARRGPWKLVVQGGSPPSLFNLKSDPGETHDLATDYPKVVKDLKDSLRNWEKDVDTNRLY